VNEQPGVSITKGAKRAVTVLFILSFLVAATSMLFTVYEVSSTGHKFCGVVTAVTAVPAQKPADPARTPAQERQFEWYQRFEALGRSLGC